MTVVVHDTRAWNFLISIDFLFKKKKVSSEQHIFQPLTSNQMLPLPEVGDPGGVVVVDRVHPSVLQPVRRGHPSPLHLHGVYFGVLTEDQHYHAGHHLSSGERCIVGSIQL